MEDFIIVQRGFNAILLGSQWFDSSPGMNFHLLFNKNWHFCRSVIDSQSLSSDGFVAQIQT